VQIAFPLFDRLTALDAIGPYEVLQRLPGATVTFVGTRTGEVRTENGFLGLTVDAHVNDLPRPDVIVVPGGIGSRKAMEDPVLVDWVRTAHGTTRFTTSVCTGSFVLGAAGLLDGLTATTHWSVLKELEACGAEPTMDRVVEHLDERIITAAGVSSGIDMALMLAAEIAGEEVAKAIQLSIEYAPEPPFDAGRIADAPDDRVKMARTGLSRP